MYDFVVHVEFNAAVFCEERKQIVDVVCEEPGRTGGKLTGDILDTFDNDVVFNVADTGSGDRAVAALVDGNIDNCRAGLHGSDHFIGKERGSELSLKECRAEDDVGVFDRVCKCRALFFKPFFGKTFCIFDNAYATYRDFFGNTGRDDFRAERHCLFVCGRTDIGRIYFRAETFCGCDRTKTCNAGTDDENVCGLDNADCRADQRHEFGDVVCAHEHALIACTGAHRGQSVHGLCAGDTRYAVKGKTDNACRRHIFDHLVVYGRRGVNERNNILTFVHHLDFVFALFFVEERFLNFQDNVGFCKNFFAIFKNGCACGKIILVMVVRAFACAFFKKNGHACGDHFLYGVGDCSNTRFVVHNFLGDTNYHYYFSLIFGFRPYFIISRFRAYFTFLFSPLWGRCIRSSDCLKRCSSESLKRRGYS